MAHTAFVLSKQDRPWYSRVLESSVDHVEISERYRQISAEFETLNVGIMQIKCFISLSDADSLNFPFAWKA
jgi:hypothetical protein